MHGMMNISPHSKKMGMEGKSPSPNKPSPGKLQPLSQNLSYSPNRNKTPSMPAMHGEYPASECLCPTCQYYKACYLYHQEAHSPDMHSYNMYPYGYYPMMPAMSPQQSMGRSSSSVPMMDAAAMGLSMPMMEREERTGNPVVEQFQQSQGSLAKIACTANGRSMLQAVMRLQHLDKIQTIFDELIVEAESVMLDSHGCHVVRSLIEVIDEHQLTKLMDVLHSKLILNMCTLSQYTRRILQTLFERHKSTNLQAIVEIMANNAQYLAATQQGCISLMRVFERCTAEQKHLIAQPLLSSFADLACDPFGNYVVQCCMEHSEPSVMTRYAIDCFSGHFLRLSCNKFGSNVTEKIIRAGNTQIRRIMLDELIFNPAALQQVASDGYGNFVIQTIVETCSSPNELKKVCDRLRPIVNQSPYGHKIEAKIRAKRFPQQGPQPAHNFKRQQAPMPAC